MKVCSKCKEEKPLNQFNKKDKKKDGTYKPQPYCRDCQKIVIRDYYQNNKEAIKAKSALNRHLYRGHEHKNPKHVYYKVIDYLAGRCCGHCGIDDIRVLEFNHLNRETKEFTIATMLKNNMDWDLILKEIAKCEILCANCHKIVTDTERNSYRHKYLMGL